MTHKSGTVFTFEGNEVVEIDFKDIATKELRSLTQLATSVYRKEKVSSTCSVNETAECYLSNSSNSNNSSNLSLPKSGRPRLTLSKKNKE